MPRLQPQAATVVDWNAGQRRRQRLEAELARIIDLLPSLGVQRAILFGSLAEESVRGQSDLDLILISDTREPFTARCAQFYRALAPSVAVDLLVYTPDEFEVVRERPFFRHALARGKVLFEA